MLDRNAEIVNLSLPKKQRWPIPIDIFRDYVKVKNVVLRAYEMQELKERNTPEVFLEWAENKAIEVPEALRQAVSINKNTAVNGMTKTKMLSLLKAKKEEIASLQKRIEVLENLAWTGVDENFDTYFLKNWLLLLKLMEKSAKIGSMAAVLKNRSLFG